MVTAAESSSASAAGATLAGRMGETTHRSPLRWRGQSLGMRKAWDLLALAVTRGCRHFVRIAPTRLLREPELTVLSNEELLGLLLSGANEYEPFLIRAAAELLRATPFDAARLAALARRERCARVLAYIAQAGAAHDQPGASFWKELLAALGPQRPVPPGVLPHWTRFVALEGMTRAGRDVRVRWIGAAA